MDRMGKSRFETSRDLALFAATAAIEKHALEPVLLDVRANSSYTDFILILSGRSMRQVEAIGEALQLALKREGENPLGVEGERGGHWVLLDYGNLVINIFHHPMRDYYDLRGLHDEAEEVELDVPPEQRVASLY